MFSQEEVSNSIPGPKVNIVKMLLDRSGPEQYLRLLCETSHQYGGLTRFKFVNQTVYLLDDAEYIKHVLRTNSKNYRKSDNEEPIKMVVGQGLFTSEGDFWRRQRRLAQPAFHRRRIADLVALMSDETELTMQHWANSAEKQGQPLDISKEMTALALRIVGKALFGSDVEKHTEKIYRAATFQNSYIDNRLWGLIHLPHKVPTPNNLRFKRSLRDLDEVVYGLIEQRKRSKEQKDDLLSMLLESRDDGTGERMSEKQLRDEVMTLLLAGTETTANALSWTWYLLAEHPQVEQTLHDELDPSRSDGVTTVNSLYTMPYTRMLFQESLRLYPPAWILTRQPLLDDAIDGYRIPAGSTLLISPYVTHRNPHYWQEPYAFIPERFREEDSKARPEFAYLPFGGGPRQCIGSSFAMTEGQVILSSIARRYRLRLASNSPVEAEPVATLRPRHGMPMTVEKR